MHAKTQLDSWVEQLEFEQDARQVKTYVMLLPSYSGKGMDAVYSVQAASYDEARQKIVDELSPKLKRLPILNAWLKCGRPLRIHNERNSTTFADPLPTVSEPAGGE